jgi:hypothetical protein
MKWTLDKSEGGSTFYDLRSDDLKRLYAVIMDHHSGSGLTAWVLGNSKIACELIYTNAHKRELSNIKTVMETLVRMDGNL